MTDVYANLMLTEEFVASIGSVEPLPSQADIIGILVGLDELDADPTNLRNRLHRLDRELKDWWSLAPQPPANPALRILVRPERVGDHGIWRVGPVTWH